MKRFLSVTLLILITFVGCQNRGEGNLSKLVNSDQLWNNFPIFVFYSNGVIYAYFDGEKSNKNAKYVSKYSVLVDDTDDSHYFPSEGDSFLMKLDDISALHSHNLSVYVCIDLKPGFLFESRMVGIRTEVCKEARVYKIKVKRANKLFVRGVKFAFQTMENDMLNYEMGNKTVFLSNDKMYSFTYITNATLSYMIYNGLYGRFFGCYLKNSYIHCSGKELNWDLPGEYGNFIAYGEVIFDYSKGLGNAVPQNTHFYVLAQTSDSVTGFSTEFWVTYKTREVLHLENVVGKITTFLPGFFEIHPNSKGNYGQIIGSEPYFAVITGSHIFYANLISGEMNSIIKRRLYVGNDKPEAPVEVVGGRIYKMSDFCYLSVSGVVECPFMGFQYKIGNVAHNDVCLFDSGEGAFLIEYVDKEGGLNYIVFSPVGGVEEMVRVAFSPTDDYGFIQKLCGAPVAIWKDGSVLNGIWINGKNILKEKKFLEVLDEINSGKGKCEFAFSLGNFQIECPLGDNSITAIAEGNFNVYNDKLPIPDVTLTVKQLYHNSSHQ